MFDYLFSTIKKNKFVATRTNDEPIAITSNASIEETSNLLELKNEIEKIEMQNKNWYSLVDDLKKDLKFIKIIDNCFLASITMNFISLIFIKNIPLIPALLLCLSAMTLFTKLVTIPLYGTQSKINKKINYLNDKINDNKVKSENLRQKEKYVQEKINYYENSFETVSDEIKVKDEILIRKLTR